MTDKLCSGCKQHLPVDHFAIRAYNDDGTPRTWQSPCRKCASARDHQRAVARREHPNTVLTEVRTMLPVGPIAGYLARWMERDGVDTVAFRCGVSQRRLWQLVNFEYHTVNLDAVDRMLCMANLPGVLMELYPELYVWTDDVAVAA